MKKISFLTSVLVLSFLSIFMVIHKGYSQSRVGDIPIDEIEKELHHLIDDGDIPGISIVIIKDNQQLLMSYGYADLETLQLVTPNTLFEIGSCSKAFTSLAVSKLREQGKINLKDNVSKYLPWLKVFYKDEPAEITIEQLLHHTSGISWNTISMIPQSDKADALEMTIQRLNGLQLVELPGKKFEYATINYDILGLIIQVITTQSFEAFLQTNVMDELGLAFTSIGRPVDEKLMSKGYRTGFLRPRRYDAPVFKGNNAAAYVISNAIDIAKWMRFQMGLTNSEMYPLAQTTQMRDTTVPLHGMASYAQGWNVLLDGSGMIYHSGKNPNFTSHIIFSPEKKTGIAVLANVNSDLTPVIAERAMKILNGEVIERRSAHGDGGDKAFTLLFMGISLYSLAVFSFIIYVMVGVQRKQRVFTRSVVPQVGRLILSFVFIVPFLYGIHLLPEALAGFNWESVLIWTPSSFEALIIIILVAIIVSEFAYGITLFFPEENKYKQLAPQIILASLLSGLSNVVIIILVMSGAESTKDVKYVVFYYFLALMVYILGRKFVQINLIRFTRGLLYDLTIQLIKKIFSTSYQNFEKIDKGRVYTAFGTDIHAIGQSSTAFFHLITCIITALGAFLYLTTIASWVALLTTILIVALSVVYFFVGQSSSRYLEESRETRNVFMGLVNGMIDGFKEISLKQNKRLEYEGDVARVAKEFREKSSIADIRFINAAVMGDLLLVGVLGAVSFGVREMFPDIELHVVMSFVIIFLYLIGPINGILVSVPTMLNFRVAYRRLNVFIQDVPANIKEDEIVKPLIGNIQKFSVNEVYFQYVGGSADQIFSIGPISFEINKGEILFIIGGNGSGKTTLAKLIVGLYLPDSGSFKINDEVVESHQLGEYFSAVFSPMYIFDKLYCIDIQKNREKIQNYLKRLELDNKVSLVGNSLSASNLSAGQKKRLALLQCYLENSPIYLFDEWAADQDPHFRLFFYRTLLPEMKAAGKMVIAITHDDHYFDVADKVLKMDTGKIDMYKEFSTPVH